jgi:hypothetical protein
MTLATETIAVETHGVGEGPSALERRLERTSWP